MNCRHCHTPLKQTFLDLGFAPPSNAYLTKEDLNKPELYFPLKLKVCTNCWLVQTVDYTQASELFSPHYAYFSSTSSGWLAHARHYCEKIIDSINLNKDSLVIEIASNDGYLLRNFVDAGIPCLGIEPTASTAIAAEKLGIPVIREFFGLAMAKQLSNTNQKADLIIGNNVFAHVPDINDFTTGLKTALKTNGTITLEFPHLLQLIKHNQFDTIYHEHFSYLSLYTVRNIFAKAGLRVFDVEELPTHGGSLRIYGCHVDDIRPDTHAIESILFTELQDGLQTLETYLGFQSRVDIIKNDLLSFLLDQKKEGKKVAAYGAAAKGNTLLNYAGIKPDLLPVVCDAAPSKQGKYMPGSHIPIKKPGLLKEIKPDIVLILPWNIAKEVIDQHQYINDWAGKFIIAVPEINILELPV